MGRFGLITLAYITAAMFILNLTYAADGVSGKANKIDGAGKGFKAAADSVVFEAVPAGIDPENIPGQGKHLGWNIGQHKGWGKVESVGEKIAAEMAKAGAAQEEIKDVIADFSGAMQKWLNERPKFDINATGENGIAGFRQAVKNWLEERPELSETIKELNDIDVSQ